jgi:hypothetical protein
MIDNNYKNLIKNLNYCRIRALTYLIRSGDITQINLNLKKKQLGKAINKKYIKRLYKKTENQSYCRIFNINKLMLL